MRCLSASSPSPAPWDIEWLAYRARPLVFSRIDLQTPNGERYMPTMSDSRRKSIQAKQRKAENAKKREAKVAKKVRNAKKGAAR